jgi:hypothetical protein
MAMATRAIDVAPRKVTQTKVHHRPSVPGKATS